MPPTMRFSIVLAGLEFFAEADVEDADGKEGGGHAQVDEIVHGKGSVCVSEAIVPLPSRWEQLTRG